MDNSHCSDIDCPNYFASGTRGGCCLMKKADASYHCSSNRDLCFVCGVNFVDDDKYLCEECNKTHVQKWTCKSCNEEVLGLNEMGLCIDCEDEYIDYSHCSCGELKYLSIYTGMCYQCSEGKF